MFFPSIIWLILCCWLCSTATVFSLKLFSNVNGAILLNASRITVVQKDLSSPQFSQLFSLDVARALAVDPSRIRLFQIVANAASAPGLVTFDILPKYSNPNNGVVATDADSTTLGLEFQRQFFNFAASLLSLGDITRSMDITKAPIINNAVLMTMCIDMVFRSVCTNGFYDSLATTSVPVVPESSSITSVLAATMGTLCFVVLGLLFLYCYRRRAYLLASTAKPITRAYLDSVIEPPPSASIWCQFVVLIQRICSLCTWCKYLSWATPPSNSFAVARLRYTDNKLTRGGSSPQYGDKFPHTASAGSSNITGASAVIDVVIGEGRNPNVLPDTSPQSSLYQPRSLNDALPTTSANGLTVNPLQQFYANQEIGYRASPSFVNTRHGHVFHDPSHEYIGTEYQQPNQPQLNLSFADQHPHSWHEQYGDVDHHSARHLQSQRNRSSENVTSLRALPRPLDFLSPSKTPSQHIDYVSLSPQSTCISAFSSSVPSVDSIHGVRSYAISSESSSKPRVTSSPHTSRSRTPRY